jgi:uncharacterized membrane protein
MSPVLLLHISAASVGLLTGAVALVARKGETAHRAAGRAFSLAMLTMTAAAAWLSVTVPGQGGNLPGAVFTFYLVATAWATMRRPPMTVGRWDKAALAVPTLAAGVMIFFTFMAVTDPASQPMNAPPLPAYFIMTTLICLVAGLDLKVVMAGGVAGRARLTRHLWRMCVGFFVATGSFFLGKQAHMPAMVRGSPLLVLLAVAPLLAMAFWLARVGMNKRAVAA